MLAYEIHEMKKKSYKATKLKFSKKLEIQKSCFGVNLHSKMQTFLNVSEHFVRKLNFCSRHDLRK